MSNDTSVGLWEPATPEAVRLEREACAAIADGYAHYMVLDGQREALLIAETIRGLPDLPSNRSSIAAERSRCAGIAMAHEGLIEFGGAYPGVARSVAHAIRERT